jgi:hypothetical protein
MPNLLVMLGLGRSSSIEECREYLSPGLGNAWVEPKPHITHDQTYGAQSIRDTRSMPQHELGPNYTLFSILREYTLLSIDRSQLQGYTLKPGAG